MPYHACPLARPPPPALRPLPSFRHVLRPAGGLALLALLACDGAGTDTGDAGSGATAGGLTASDAAAPDAAGDAPRPAIALAVVAEEARDGDLVLRVKTRGDIYGDAIVNLSPEVSGTVAEVFVRPGARVTRGQPLVRLEPFPFDLAVREAQAALDEREQAYRESFMPESLVTGVGPTPEQRRALRIRSGVAAAEVRLERARWERARSEVTAPVDGVVDRFAAAPGERLAAGAPFATLVDVGAVRIEARVLEDDLPLIRVGGEALVTSAAVPGRTLRGRIDAVLPLVDSVRRTGRVIVRVPGERSLRPGMYADVDLEAQRLPARRLVPTRAIIERDARPLVFVVRDGRAQWTYILPGRSNGVETEVLPDSVSGEIPVRPGDQVIVDGHLTLTHDAAVTVSAVRERDGVRPARRDDR
jgi:RND family efflux transporter MFP subunit